MCRISHTLGIVALLLFLCGCGEEETPLHRKARELSQNASEAQRRGAFGESKALLTEALEIYGRLEDLAGIAEASLSLGELHSRAAQFDSAFLWFDRAREAYSQQADKEGVRATVRARAGAHRARGEYRKALEVLHDELRAEEALGENYGARDLKMDMLPLCRRIDNTELEDRLLRELNEQFADEEDRTKRRRLLYESGLAALHRGAYDDALKHFAEGLTLARQARDSLLVIALYQWRAVTFERQGKITESFREFTAGLQLTDSVGGAEALREEMLIRVGNIYLRRGRPKDAPRFFTRALKSASAMGKKLLEGYAMIQLGHCASKAASADAADMYRAAAELLDSLGVPWARAYAHGCLGAHALRQNRVSEALTSFTKAAAFERAAPFTRDAFDIFVDCERTFYDLEHRSPSEAATELLLQLQKMEEAFLTFERRRRTLLMSAYNDMEPRTKHQALNDGLQTFARARGDYIGAVQRLAEVSAEYNPYEPLTDGLRRAVVSTGKRVQQLGDSLGAAYPRMGAVFTTEPVPLAQLQRHIPEGTALVVYIPTPRTLSLLLLSRSGASVTVSSIGKAALRDLMSEYSTALSRAAQERGPQGVSNLRLREISARLYGLLIRPIERSAGRIQRLVVALPPDLPLIPLHALQQEGARGAFAIQRFAFQYCADPGILQTGRPSLRLYPRVVGFGNPGRTSVDVEYEIRDAQAFFREAKLLMGRDAMMASLVHAEGDLLHAALDIQYREAHPGNSVVSFKDATGYTSIRDVPIGELFSLPSFNTILLSNLNDRGAHAAVVHILQMNGTAAVVMNSHLPPRKTKKAFNEGFYVNLVRGTSVDEAYRNTILGMIKDAQQSQPWLWGAFFLW
jgi:tetratricopeptide (TPR) repeat protein